MHSSTSLFASFVSAESSIPLPAEASQLPAPPVAPAAVDHAKLKNRGALEEVAIGGH